MIYRRKSFSIVLILGPVCLCAQLLDPAAFKKPPTDTWPTYNGDYSGQRHSTLSQINATNVKSLVLAWTHRFDLGSSSSKGQKGDQGRRIKATPLLVRG